MKRISFPHRIAAALLFLVATTAVTIPSYSTASAWPWDPNVVLNGRVTCSPLLGTSPVTLRLSGSNGEGGLAILSGTGITRSYSYQFRRVVGTITVTATWQCGGLATRTSPISLSRPNVGNNATVNLCSYRPCLI